MCIFVGEIQLPKQLLEQFICSNDILTINILVKWLFRGHTSNDLDLDILDVRLLLVENLGGGSRHQNKTKTLRLKIDYILPKSRQSECAGVTRVMLGQGCTGSRF